MNYVGVSIRFIAVVLDAIVLFVIGYILALTTGVKNESGFALGGGPAFLAFFIWFCYYVYLEGSKGATLGKMAAGIKVTTVDGERIGWREAFIRNILRPVDGIVFYLLAAILVWSTARNQRLGDLLAGTVVVWKQER